MIKNFLEIGQIVSTHGIHGELRVQPWCDDAEFMKQFKTLYLDGEGKKPLRVLSCRPHTTIVLLSLEGIDTVEKAAAMRNKVLYMNRSEAKIAEGSYFVQDLIDCRVIDNENEGLCYGVITDVSKTGANDVWHVTKEGKEYLLPAIPPVVKHIDVVSGIIKITPLKGIFEDAD